MTIPDNLLGLDGFEYVEFTGPNPEALAGLCTAMVPTADIFATVDAMCTNGIRFQDGPDSYFDMIDERLPGHGQIRRGVIPAAAEHDGRS